MIFIEEKQIQIKSFENNDFKIVKNFILECYKDMTHQDFFIIDDIEIALPAMFTDTGAVYGAYYDGE